VLSWLRSEDGAARAAVANVKRARTFIVAAVVAFVWVWFEGSLKDRQCIEQGDTRSTR
jgi:hypothetical protein